MLKKYLYNHPFPVAIGTSLQSKDVEAFKRKMGKVLLNYLTNEKGLEKFLLSIPDWEIGDPYSVDKGRFGDALILFSRRFSDDEKESISKSLTLLSEKIWDAGYPGSATATIMTNLNMPVFARIDRLCPFDFRIVQFGGYINWDVTGVPSDEIKKLYGPISNIDLSPSQKENIANNRLQLMSFTKECLKNTPLQFSREVIDAIKQGFKNVVSELDASKGTEGILWNFWKSFLYFYDQNEESKHPYHIFFITLPPYKKSDNTLVSPLCFILAVWDQLDLTFNLIDDHAFHDLLYLLISQWAILDNFKVARRSLTPPLIKSAIAAIMSRNGSHNIGSHVLAAVGTKNNDLPDDQILFKYIQHRMDYIAQIATEFPNWTYSTWFVRDLMRRFYMQRHLLNYIANAEGLSAYEFQPKNERDQQKSRILIEICKKGENSFLLGVDQNEQHAIKGDVQIAVPGGIVGHQAFHTIIENIIRNAAKHGWSLLPEDSKPSNLEITIEIDDEKKRDFVIFRIYDNVSKLNDSDNELISDINKKLSTSFVDQKTGKLLKSHWGLAEMKISAGFLNRRNILHIGSNKEEDIIFKIDHQEKTYSGIISATKCKKDTSFGYEFAVPRPREVLIVGDSIKVIEKLNGDGDGGDFKSKLLENSIYLEEELTDQTNLDYEFVVLWDDGKNKFRAKLENEIEMFPFRLFIVSDATKPINEPSFLTERIVVLKPDDVALKNGNLSDVKLFLFKKWISHLMKRMPISAVSCVDTGSDENPSEKKGLKMLVHLSGDQGHADEEIVKLVFYKFKDQLLDSLLTVSSEIDNKIITKLRGVTNSDIDDYAKKEGMSNPNKLIDGWSTKAGLNSNEKTTFLKQGTKKRAKIYFEILKEMYVRYDEDCQTLPKAYRGENSPSSSTLNDSIDIDGLKISYTSNENENGIDIAYNRHELKDAKYYSEALSGSQIYFSLLQNLPNENNCYNKHKMLLQLVENALLRVVVIDERVAQFYCACNDMLRKRFKRGGLKIPTTIAVGRGEDSKICQLYEDTSDSNDTFSIDGVAPNTYDVLIIHQGVLDKIVPNSNPKPLKELLNKIKESIPFVIITSGRGEPENIPENAKFLPFSNIESFLLTDFPEKFLLTQMLMKISA